MIIIDDNNTHYYTDKKQVGLFDQIVYIT